MKRDQYTHRQSNLVVNVYRIIDSSSKYFKIIALCLISLLQFQYCSKWLLPAVASRFRPISICATVILN